MARTERGLLSSGDSGGVILCFWQSDVDIELLASGAVPE